MGDYTIGTTPVDGQVVSGLTWAEPVDKPSDLANMLDSDGTARLCLWNNFGYVKDGPTWFAFVSADDTDGPAPVHTNAVDRLADLTREEEQNGQA